MMINDSFEFIEKKEFSSIILIVNYLKLIFKK